MEAASASTARPVVPVMSEIPPSVAPAIARPVMTQFWADLVFLHWRYRIEDVQRLLPDGVHVDAHDGSAWVALVPFRMERLGVPGGGPLPGVSTFPEVNVRTYVRSGDRRGVWFFSLDIDRLLPTAVARVGYRLPYCWGAADHVRAGDHLVTRVVRRWPRSPAATTEIVVRAGERFEATDLERFLTNRWGLIAGRAHKLRFAPVDHPVWPLHRAELVHLDDSLIEAAGLPAPAGDPHVMWSPGVDVRVGLPRSA